MIARKMALLRSPAALRLCNSAVLHLQSLSTGADSLPGTSATGITSLTRYHRLTRYSRQSSSPNPLANHFHTSTIRFPIKKRVYEKIARKKEEGLFAELIGYNNVQKKLGLTKPTHTVETQIKYMNSKAYEDAYEGLPIYLWYKRNHWRTWLYQSKPRMFCITKDCLYNTNNPCPVCRDEYLWFDYRNPALLEQFLESGSDQPRAIWKTGLCREQYGKLQAEVLRAKEQGTLQFTVPFRYFDYSDYYPHLKQTKEEKEKLAADRDFEEPDFIPGPLHQYRDLPYLPYDAHKRDTHNGWDEWWLRWEKFARKGSEGKKKSFKK